MAGILADGHARALSSASASADERAAGSHALRGHAGFETGVCAAGPDLDAPSSHAASPEFVDIARAPQHIWQRRFHDFNVWTGRKFLRLA